MSYMDSTQSFAGHGGRPVRCREFLDAHSDFLDGLLSEGEATRFELHREVCASCGRYDRTVRDGLQLLRTLPEIEPSDDFLPRLQHRIYHLEDQRALVGPSGRLPALLAVVVVAAVAASPLLRNSASAPEQGTTAALERAEPAQPPAPRHAPRDWHLSSGARAAVPTPLPAAPRLAPPSAAVLAPVDGGEYLRLRTIHSLDSYPAGPYSPLVYGPPRFADGPGAPRLAGAWTSVSAYD
jgi:hypothetical protein